MLSHYLYEEEAKLLSSNQSHDAFSHHTKHNSIKTQNTVN